MVMKILFFNFVFSLVLLLLSVCPAVVTQSAPLYVRVRSDGLSAIGHPPQHGETQPADLSICGLLPKHLHPTRLAHLQLHAGLRPRWAPAPESVPGLRQACDLQIQPSGPAG